MNSAIRIFIPLKKIAKRYFLIILVGIISLSFLFSPTILPDNPELQQILHSPPKNDIIILFASGGWGNTSLKKAKDFFSIIRGIQETLSGEGFNPIILSYQRTKRGTWSKISGIKEELCSFCNQSEYLATQIDKFLDENPDKKILMTGLSNGAYFVNETMKRLSMKKNDKVYAIIAGPPFWAKIINSNNILYLDNNGKDRLSQGDLKILAIALMKAPFKWIYAKMKGENLSFSESIQVPGHQYLWSSPEVKQKIVRFIKNNLSYAKR